MPEFDFNTLITDRSQADVDAVRELLLKVSGGTATVEELAQFNLAKEKGAYNYTDLNRVTAAMDYINNQLVGYGYQTGYQRVEIPHATPQPVSPLPEGYTQLAYIESTGTQYVDTGFQPDNNTRVVLDIMALTAGTYTVFGARKGVGDSAFALWLTGETSIEDDYGTARDSVTVSTTLGRVTVDKNKNVLSFGATEHEISAQTFSPGYNLTLFAMNSAGAIDRRMVSARLYSCQIYDDNVMVRYLVPCKNSSDVCGLFDLINGDFYQNSGAGAFTAGQDITPEEPDTPDTPTDARDPYTWYEDDIPTLSLMTAYLNNVSALRAVLTLFATTPEPPASMTALNFVAANNIEQILVDIENVITSFEQIFPRSGMAWAIAGGPNFYFAN